MYNILNILSFFWVFKLIFILLLAFLQKKEVKNYIQLYKETKIIFNNIKKLYYIIKILR